jgi:hypothetical protein
MNTPSTAVGTPPAHAAAGGRRWARHTAVAVSGLAAVVHLASSPAVVKAYTDSDLEDTPKIEAVLLWFLTTVTFASIPVALAWSTRVPAQVARPLQAYAGALVGGLAAVSLPVTLVAHGPSGLLKVPQFIGSSLITAVIFAGRTPAEES